MGKKNNVVDALTIPNPNNPLAPITIINNGTETTVLNPTLIGGSYVRNNATGETRQLGGNTSLSTILMNVLGWIFWAVSTAFSFLVVKMVAVMLTIMNYPLKLNDILVVNRGWSVIRDMSNNFFIVILLVIAVSTVLQIPNYHWRQLLPKLLIMAVLINFSKLFVGIMIDASQILMLTFAQPLSGVTGNNIILAALGMPDLFQFGSRLGTLAQNNNLNISGWDVFFALVFALIAGVVAFVVITVICIMLVYRIIMLLFLTILSPLPFLLTTFPKGREYAGQWWSEISKYLMVGPVLLFFLWISFTAMGGSSIDGQASNQITQQMVAGRTIQDPSTQLTGGLAQGGDLGEDFATLSKAASIPGIINFLIVIGLMVGSLAMAQKMGVKGGEWAGKGLGVLDKMRKGSAKWVGGKAVRTGLTGAGAAFKGLGMIGRIPGIRRIPGVGTVGKAIEGVGDLGLGLAKDMRKARKRRLSGAFLKRMQKMGMGEEALQATDKLLSKKGAKGVAGVVGGIAAAGGTALLTGGLGLVPLLGGALIGGVATWLGARTAAGAAKQGTQDYQRAKLFTKNNKGKKDIIKSSKESDWTSPDGQRNYHIQKARALADSGDVDAIATVNNMVEEINNETAAKPATLGEQKVIEALAKTIAHHEKEGNALGNLGLLKTAINNYQSRPGAGGGLDGDVDSYKDKVFSARYTGKGRLKKEKGQLTASREKADEFAVDFRDIEEAVKGAGVDVDVRQEGLHIEGDKAVRAVSDKLNRLIDNELKKLDASIAAGTAKEVDKSHFKRLSGAKERLSSSDLKSMDLLNSGVVVEGGFAANFRSSAITQTHEAIHSAGVKNEVTTEELAQHIQKNHLYSKTAEIGQEAAALEKSGQDFTTEDVMNNFKAKYGSDERVSSAIQKEEEAQAGRAEGKQKASTIPGIMELREAVNSSGGVFGRDDNFYLLLSALTGLDKSIKSFGKNVGAVGENIGELTRGINNNSVPLEVKVATEEIEKTINK